MKPARPQHQPIALYFVDIPVPCTASWDEMMGDVRVRHCAGCNKNVVNLSAMPAVEGAALIAENVDGALCVRMDKRHDGRIVSSDDDDSECAPARQPWRTLPGLAGAAVLALSAAGCSTADVQPVPPTSAGVALHPEPPTTVLMGAPPAVVAPTSAPVKGARQCEEDAQLQPFIGKVAAGYAMPSVLIDSKGICTR